MLPQFMRKEAIRPHIKNIVVGLTIFFIGLFKKAVLADGVAVGEADEDVNPTGFDVQVYV